MSKLTVILILLLSHYQHITFGQSLNQRNDNGQRIGKWEKVYEGTDQVRYSGNFDNGKEIGTFLFYDRKGGHPTATKEYKEGSEIIIVNFYTTDGKKVSSGTMKGKVRIGDWISYHQDGVSVMIKEYYGPNGLEGERMVYFMSGNPAQVENYANGVKNGKSLFYSDEGAILKEQYYKDDKLEGPVKLYNGLGQLKAEGAYKKNRKHGIWTYYENGKVSEKIKYPQNKIGVQG